MKHLWVPVGFEKQKQTHHAWCDGRTRGGMIDAGNETFYDTFYEGKKRVHHSLEARLLWK